MIIMTAGQIQAYAQSLRMEEHSESTVEKYSSAVADFYSFLPDEKEVTKENLLVWKGQISARYAVGTVNVMISAVNRFLNFIAHPELRLKQVKTQRKIYRDRERELTKEEYLRLLATARKRGNMRLYYIMQTLASTGIRISELRFITLEAVSTGTAVVDCKGKQRTVFLAKKLRTMLLTYCKQAGIVTGSVFVTKSGNPVNRSNTWKEMQKLCAAANVNPHKVFPHNFRHLFAVTHYRQHRDIAKLADLLGHASIDTTRIYIMESGTEHARQMERLGLVI